MYLRRYYVRPMDGGGEGDLDRVWEVANKAPRVTGRSAAYRWMVANYGEFASRLETDFPGWPGIGLGLAKIGVVNRKGQPYSADALRKAWWEVRRDKAAFSEVGLDVAALHEAIGARPGRRRKPKRERLERGAQPPSHPPPLLAPNELAPGVLLPEPATRNVIAKSAHEPDALEAVRRQLRQGQEWIPTRRKTDVEG